MESFADVDTEEIIIRIHQLVVVAFASHRSPELNTTVIKVTICVRTSYLSIFSMLSVFTQNVYSTAHWHSLSIHKVGFKLAGVLYIIDVLEEVSQKNGMFFVVSLTQIKEFL